MKDLEKFKPWLLKHGCEILPPTNEYEIIRWKGAETGVIYGSGRTSGKYASNALKCFYTNQTWKGGPVSTGRENSYKSKKKVLLKRDGTRCFLCDEELGEDITVDHLVPLAAGGSNKLSNMVLMHQKCNGDCGHMPLNQKVTLAIEIRVNKAKQKM